MCEIDKPAYEFPAIKIARLAVAKEHQEKHLGSIIVLIAIGMIRRMVGKIVACRFITVDSYHSKVEFYEKAGFKVNEHRHYTKKKNYISMRFDLLNPKQ